MYSGFRVAQLSVIVLNVFLFFLNASMAMRLMEVIHGFAELSDDCYIRSDRTGRLIVILIKFHITQCTNETLAE